jgi:hypothetical protein
MITLLRRSTVPAALAIALGLLGSSARADVTLQAGLNGGALTTEATVSGSPTTPGGVLATASFTIGSYTVTLNSGLETQTSSLSELLSSTLRITNSGTSSGTLNLVITGTGFTAPVTPPPVAVSSALGGSAGPISGTSDTLSFVTKVAGSSLGTGNAALAATAGTENYTAQPTVNTTLGSLVGPFSVEHDVNISLTGNGDIVQFTATTDLRPVPEPSTMALVGLGALGFIGYSLRRRKAQDT